MKTKTYTLANGVTVVLNSREGDGFTVAVTVKVGHINEPKLGIASVYEKILMLQNPNVQTVYGGTITSYLTGGTTKEEAFQKLGELANLINNPVLSPELLNEAVTDIIRHTRDRNVLPRRQLKLLYKHTAFNGHQIWDTEAYIQSLLSISIEDLQNLHDTYYTGKNLVVSFSGRAKEDVVLAQIRQIFESVPAGEEQKAGLPVYTGGYAVLQGSEPAFNRVLIGWDVTTLSNVAEANVLMSMLSGRLDRSFVDSGIDATTEVKIAGYYGCRTLRVAAECAANFEMNRLLDVICRNISRLKNELASERRMEASRNVAMTEKLFKFGDPEAAAVEVAWQILRHGEMYDVADRITATWQVSARDVQDIAREIFSKPFTCVLYGREPYYGKEELEEKMK